MGVDYTIHEIVQPSHQRPPASAESPQPASSCGLPICAAAHRTERQDDERASGSHGEISETNTTKVEGEGGGGNRSCQSQTCVAAAHVWQTALFLRTLARTTTHLCEFRRKKHGRGGSDAYTIQDDMLRFNTTL